MRLTIILTVFCINIISTIFSQVDSLIEYPDKDSYVHSDNYNNNYGINTQISIGRYANRTCCGNPTTYHTERSVLHFDLSSIPQNAIILSADLSIYNTSTAVGNPSFRAARMTGTWSETGITWYNSVSPTSLIDPTIYSNFVAGSGVQVADVKDQVQKMTAGINSNYGWMLLLSASETANSNINQTFGSKENSNSSLKPKLNIKYYIPMSVSDASIIHESKVNENDGSISPTLQDGPGGTYSYQWYNSSGLMSGKSNLVLTGVGAGWYGVKVSSTVVGSLPFYYSFLVGNKCSEISFTYNPNGDFVDDASLRSNSPSTPDPSGDILSASESGSTYDMLGLLKFRLWIPESINITQANLILTKNSQNSSSYSNECNFHKVQNNWNENFVTYSILPTHSSTSILNLPQTSNTSFNYHGAYTYNALNAFNDIKTSNALNYGWIFKLATYNNITKSQTFCTSDYDINTNNNVNISYYPKVNFTIKVDSTFYPVVTNLWDTVLDRGSILINAENICGEYPPFKYVISENLIPEIVDLYQIYIDSVSPDVIDSTDFFSGSLLTRMTYENLISNEYYIAVFNSNWVRIVDETIQLQAPISFESSTGLSVSDDEISSTTSNARGLLKAYAHQNSNSEVMFNLNQLSGEQFLGYITSTASQPTSYTQLLYGFRINNNNVYCIQNGAILGSYFSVSTTDEISLKIEDGVLHYKIGNAVIQSVNLNAEFELKLTVGLTNTSTILKLKKYGKVLYKLPLFYFISDVSQQLTCGGETGAFNFSVSPSLWLLGGSTNINYTVKDPTNHLVKNGIGSLQSGIPINGYAGGGGLTLPGVYTISGTFGTYNTPFIGYVRIGFEADWNVISGYTEYPNNYSVVVQNPVTNEYAYAISNNIMNSTDEGWIEFRSNTNIQDVGNIFRPTTTNILASSFAVGSPINFSSISNEDYFGFINISFVFPAFFNLTIQLRSIIMHSGYSDQSSLVNVPNNPLVRLEFKNDVAFPSGKKVEVYINNGPTPVGVMDRTNANILSRCYTQMLTNGFDNIISSFGCAPEQTLDQIGYTELKRKVDGGFAYAVEGKIKFTIDEEYGMEPNKYLPLKIYNHNNSLLESCDINGNILNSSITAQDLYFDDNRWIMDVSQVCTIGEYYILEVENSKGDKRYLRFLYKN